MAKRQNLMVNSPSVHCYWVPPLANTCTVSLITLYKKVATDGHFSIRPLLLGAAVGKYMHFFSNYPAQKSCNWWSILHQSSVIGCRSVNRYEWSQAWSTTTKTERHKRREFKIKTCHKMISELTVCHMVACQQQGVFLASQPVR